MPSTSTLVSQSVLVFLFDNLSIHEDELSPPRKTENKGPSRSFESALALGSDLRSNLQRGHLDL